MSSADRAVIEPLVRQLVQGQIARTTDGLHIEVSMTGASARDLNRQLLSALRGAERRTRQRAEWTAAGVTHRFFDYVAKGTRPATGSTAPPGLRHRPWCSRVIQPGGDVAPARRVRQRCRTRHRHLQRAGHRRAITGVTRR